MPDTWLNELQDPEARQAVIDAVLDLFKRWQLHPVNQAELLGLSDMGELAQYKFADKDPVVFERIGHLLAIERGLLRRYPYHASKRDQWIWKTQPVLQGQTPMSFMLHTGIEGIKQLRQLLESVQVDA